MDIIAEVKKLNFPKNNYVVVGSSHLAALGLKEVHDIDILVNERLFTSCIKQGWEIIPWTYPERIGQVFLRKGIFELYLDVGMGNFNPTLNELLERSKLINDVAFASLEDILKFKQEYIKNNSKHLDDIKLLEEYIGKSSYSNT